MKNYLFILISAIALASCGRSVETDTTDSISSHPHDSASNNDSISQTLCFQKVSGNANQDTATVHLNINGENVVGDYENRLFEKDARTGRIDGTYKNNLIKGVWVYMQEGMTDTLPVEFKLSEDKLVQKNYTVDPKTGREVFSEGSVFNIEFEKIDCEK